MNESQNESFMDKQDSSSLKENNHEPVKVENIGEPNGMKVIQEKDANLEQSAVVNNGQAPAPNSQPAAPTSQPVAQNLQPPVPNLERK